VLGYVAGALAWGFLKSRSLDLRRSPHALSDLGFAELLEEVEYRYGIERVGLRGALGLSPTVSRTLQAAFFGLAHGNPLDAALGGFIYSKAYDAGAVKHGSLGGLALSAAAHIAHNLGVHLGGRP
jgi:hypothetical protein